MGDVSCSLRLDTCDGCNRGNDRCKDEPGEPCHISDSNAEMIPSRLIVLRRYVDREFAETDRDRLIDAGIPAYVKRVMADSARSLMVGEENVEAALALLGKSDEAGEAGESDQADLTKPIHDEALQCPRCQSSDIAPLPGYAGLSLAVGAAVALYVGFFGRVGALLPLLGATILISTVVYVKCPRWRCRVCGLVYGQPVGRARLYSRAGP
jgi:hypothetical protein